MVAATKHPKVTATWRKLLGMIPGYDCFDTAPAGSYFDCKAADKVVDFFEECLRHVEGKKAGELFKLSPWQTAHIGCAFGWKLSNGLRRYREVFDYEPRKNGKTTKAAGLVLYSLFVDEEEGSQVYSAAAEKDQAALVYRQAKGMILQEPELEKRAKIYTAVKSIVYEAKNGAYKALSADADTKHGFNTQFCVVDELHAHKNGELLDVLLTSMGSREQPMAWIITTADFSRESACNTKYDYACKVRDGIIDDPSFLPVIYEAKIEDDWTDPNVWKRCNPNLGVSVSLDFMKRECKRAQEVPSYENTFKRLHLNIQTQQDERWLQMDKWDLGGDALNMAALRGRECFGGLDLSTTTDISSFKLIFPNDDGVTYDLLCWFWCPSSGAHQREKRDKVPYETWARQGHITMTDGDVIDYDVIRADINTIGDLYSIQEIAYDPWNATQIAHQLEGDGFNMVQHRQGYQSMSPPSKELEKLVISGGLNHGGNPVLKWMASNVAIESDPAGNIKPSKKKSTEKIDGIVSVVMALARATAKHESITSIYETRGMLTL